MRLEIVFVGQHVLHRVRVPIQPSSSKDRTMKSEALENVHDVHKDDSFAQLRDIVPLGFIATGICLSAAWASFLSWKSFQLISWALSGLSLSN
jgi:hypothetical protein